MRRRDIQGLRAVAVVTVVVYHFLPASLPGGFVGVDVFFVISGFLITGLLLREAAATGGIRLGRFYGRRVRRLMPAAVTTMVVTVVVAVFVVNPIRLVGMLRDMAWTTVYLANVHFAQSPTGYFGTGERSPFLHYWSLAVEEQYYLAWPLVLVALLAVSRRAWRTAVPAMLVVVLVASLWLSVRWTSEGSASAYYSLVTRAWELAIGGLLAVIVMRGVRAHRVVRAVGGWGGMLLIAFSTLRFSEQTPFPGWTAAIPTVGAALVIWSGSTRTDGVLQRLLSVRPAQFLGNISYSLYLWHWPVFVLGLEVLGPTPGRRRLVALMALALVLATLSYLVVEQPTSRWRRSATPRRVVAAGLALTVVSSVGAAVGAAAVPSTSSLTTTAAPVDTALSSTDPITFVHLGPGPTPTSVPRNVEPALADLDSDLADVFTNGCFGAGVVVCEGGDRASSTRVVLTGDSHAGQWWPAFDAAAKLNRWHLYIVGHNGCPLADVPISEGTTAVVSASCSAWQAAAPAAIRQIRPDLVVWAANAQGYTGKVSLRDDFSRRWSTGVTTAVARLRTVSPVLILGQTPSMRSDPKRCLSTNINRVAACTTPLGIAVEPGLAAVNEKVSRDTGSRYFDPTQILCTVGGCPVMSGDAVMYRDYSHLSATYATRLAPQVGAVVAAALGAH